MRGSQTRVMAQTKKKGENSDGASIPWSQVSGFFMEKNSASSNKNLRPRLLILDELENWSEIIDCIIGEGNHLWLRESTQTFGCVGTSAVEGPLPGFDTASIEIYRIGMPAKSIDGIDSMFPSGDVVSFFNRITVPQGLPLTLNEFGNVWWSSDPEFKFNGNERGSGRGDHEPSM